MDRSSRECARPTHNPSKTRGNVGRAGGGEADQQTHRPSRVIERRCDTGHGLERDSASRQVQESSVVKSHGVIPLNITTARVPAQLQMPVAPVKPYQFNIPEYQVCQRHYTAARRQG